MMNPITILHLADSHLGYSAYRRITEEGINQREHDIYQAFQQIIDYAVIHKPDLILHAGDFFTSVRPTNRAITFSLQQLLRVVDAGIPFVVIAGNHEQPKLTETGHIFSVFDHLDTIYPVYHETYEPLHFRIHDSSLCIHAVPHINDPERYQHELQCINIDTDADYNILLTHGSVKGIKELSMHDFNELYIPQDYLSGRFDYTALGHYHTNTQVTRTASYPGSIEAFTFTDANQQKGFLSVGLSDQSPSIRFHPLPIRSVIDTPSLDCTGLNYEEITKQVINTIDSIPPEDTIFRLNLLHIPLSMYRSLDFDVIRRHSQTALHYEINARVYSQDDTTGETHVKIEALSKEFSQYMKAQQIQNKEVLGEKGLAYIKKIENLTDDS